MAVLEHTLCASIRVRTWEIRTEAYSSFTWPCASVLATWLFSQRERLAGANVLELGCGTALPGLFAALQGARVWLSDENEAALRPAAEGLRLNGCAATLLPLKWGAAALGELPSLPPFDLVLGSDVLYDSAAFDALLATASELLRRSQPAARFVTTYQQRSGHASLPWRLRHFFLRVVSLQPAAELGCSVDGVELVVLAYEGGARGL